MHTFGVLVALIAAESYPITNALLAGTSALDVLLAIMRIGRANNVMPAAMVYLQMCGHCFRIFQGSLWPILWHLLLCGTIITIEIKTMAVPSRKQQRAVIYAAWKLCLVLCCLSLSYP